MKMFTIETTITKGIAMKILILYHSNILAPKPGADEHIYTTAKFLSESNDVTVLTWGVGRSETYRFENLTIIHNGRDEVAGEQKFLSKFPSSIIYSLSYIGIYQLLFLNRARGPSPKVFRELNFNEFDIAVRISFDNNRIPKYISKRYNTKVVELAIVSGLPHYIENANNWSDFYSGFSPIKFTFFRQLNKVIKRVVFSFYLSSLASRNVIVISEYDRKVLEKIKKLEVIYTPAILNFKPNTSIPSREKTVIFFSGKTFVSILASEYILHIANELPEIKFSITGFITDKLKEENVPSNVIIHGYLEIEKFHELLVKSSVVIFPLISGSGLQTKMVEALSMGKPIITTSVISGEFPELLDGIHVLIEDDPLEFTKKIKILIEDIDLRSKLSKNAIEYYKTHFDQELALETHLRYFSKVLGER